MRNAILSVNFVESVRSVVLYSDNAAVDIALMDSQDKFNITMGLAIQPTRELSPAQTSNFSLTSFP